MVMTGQASAYRRFAKKNNQAMNIQLKSDARVQNTQKKASAKEVNFELIRVFNLKSFGVAKMSEVFQCDSNGVLFNTKQGNEEF